VLLATANGYGKRTALEEFPTYKRGGQGVIGIQVSERNGALVAALSVNDDDDVMLTSNAGTLVRTSASEISRLSRNTQGVTLIRLADKEQVIGMARVAASEEDDEEILDDD
jgi:DNA gyrase subunit A